MSDVTVINPDDGKALFAQAVKASRARAEGQTPATPEPLKAAEPAAQSNGSAHDWQDEELSPASDGTEDTVEIIEDGEASAEATDVDEDAPDLDEGDEGELVDYEVDGVTYAMPKAIVDKHQADLEAAKQAQPMSLEGLESLAQNDAERQHLIQGLQQVNAFLNQNNYDIAKVSAQVNRGEITMEQAFRMQAEDQQRKQLIEANNQKLAEERQKLYETQQQRRDEILVKFHSKWQSQDVWAQDVERDLAAVSQFGITPQKYASITDPTLHLLSHAYRTAMDELSELKKAKETKQTVSKRSKRRVVRANGAVRRAGKSVDLQNAKAGLNAALEMQGGGDARQILQAARQVSRLNREG